MNWEYQLGSLAQVHSVKKGGSATPRPCDLLGVLTQDF